MVYWIRNCFSQIEEEEDTKLKKEFWKALGVFIRLKIFPRIRQEKVNLLIISGWIILWNMLRLLVEPCKDNTFYRISQRYMYKDETKTSKFESDSPSAKPQLQRISEIPSEQMEENGPISSMKCPTTSLNQAESDEIITTTTTTITPIQKMIKSATVEQDGSSMSENYSSVFDDSNNPSTMTTPIPLTQSAAQNTSISEDTTEVSPTTITLTPKTMNESATVEQNDLSMSETNNSFNDSSDFEESNNPSATMTPISITQPPAENASILSPKISPKIIQSENDDTHESQAVNINPKYDETSSDPEVTIDYKSDERNEIRTDSVTSELKNECSFL